MSFFQSSSLHSRRSPSDSDFSFDFEKIVSENKDLKEELAQVQSERDRIRSAWQAAEENEDKLQAERDDFAAQLEELQEQLTEVVQWSSELSHN